jgi:hypothetical protein
MTDISTWVWERVDADDTLDDDKRYLILAAHDGDQALAALDCSAAKPQRPAPSDGRTEPAGAKYVRAPVTTRSPRNFSVGIAGASRAASGTMTMIDSDNDA